MPDESEGVRSFCVNIYRCGNFLSDCISNKGVYHSVFTRSDVYLGAEHVLEHI